MIYSTSAEFLAPSLFSAVGHLMSTSTIKALRTYSQSFVFYTALIGNPSTGKSTGMGLVKKALEKVERFNAVPSQDSKLVNGKIQWILVFSFSFTLR